jgi:hypothetical protein
MKLKLVFATATAVGLLMGSGVVLAAPGGGSVYLSQTGNDQNAEIDQTSGNGDKVGTSVGSPFIQENYNGTGSNKLVINQNAWTTSEFANPAAFSNPGSNNTTTGWQAGTENSAEIDQEGSNSTVSLQQTGAHNGWTGAGTSGDPWSNSPYANAIVQDYTANYSSIDLKQTSTSATAKGNFFSVGQGGYNNKITATATSTSNNVNRPSNDLWIRQGTTAPESFPATWWGVNPFDPAVTSNSLSAVNNSKITVTQTGGGVDAINYAALGQGGGSTNQMTVTQTNGNNNLDANQIGGGNIFTSTQANTGAGDYSANDWNFVGGEGGWPAGYDNPFASGDPGPIMQIGTGNEYNSIQSGMNLWAFGSQIGNYNFLSSTQTGNLDVLYTAQNGNNNEIYSIQDGTSNTETVSQSHNLSYSNVNQQGTGNNASILQ